MSSMKQLQTLAKQETTQIAGVIMRTEAITKMYECASFLNQGKEMDELRLQLHALLDVRLDHQNRVMHLTREMMQLPPD